MGNGAIVRTRRIDLRMTKARAGVVWRLVRETCLAWQAGEIPRLGAAIAYYTIFAIAPLFVIVLAFVGFWVGEEAAQRQLFSQINGLVGQDGGEAIQAIVAAANRPKAGIWATAAAMVTLFAGATGVFIELEDALNKIWEVPSKPNGGWWTFVRKRLLSFAMVLAIGFLLLVSLSVSAALEALGQLMSGWLPAHQSLWQIINFLVSLGVITVLFALILKVLPPAQIAWGDVWVGSLVTALLFNVGKSLLGLYIGRSSVASAYGAAGSFVVILIWVYYSAQILLLGAKFTQVYARHYGSHQNTPVADKSSWAVAKSRNGATPSG